jgi:hypothetical protein
MDRSTLERGASRSTMPPGSDRISPYPILKILRRIVRCHHPEEPAIKAEDERPIRTAQPDRAFGDCFKHRLEIER